MNSRVFARPSELKVTTPCPSFRLLYVWKLGPATLEFWDRFQNERNQGKQAHPALKYRVPHGSQLYQSLKSKVGLAATKAAALRINLNVQGCGIVAAPVHAPSRAPPPPSFTQSSSPPRSLVRDGQTSPHRPRLVVSRSTCPPLFPSPHANGFVIVNAVINKHTSSGSVSVIPSACPLSPPTYGSQDGLRLWLQRPTFMPLLLRNATTTALASFPSSTKLIRVSACSAGRVLRTVVLLLASRSLSNDRSQARS